MAGLEFVCWDGLWGPKSLPAPILAVLNGPLAEIMREPTMVERFTALGLEPVYAGPHKFHRFITADVARNSELLRSANFQPE